MRFGGRDHSLTGDERVARQRYAEKLKDWAAWRADVEAESNTRKTRSQLTVAELAERMFDAYTAEGRRDTARWFAKHLVRWLNIHGAARVLDLSTADVARGVFAAPVVPLLNAYLADLGTLDTPLSPRTLRHDVTSIKRLFNFAAEQGLCPPVQWRGVRRVRVLRSEPEDLPPEGVRELIAIAAKNDPGLVSWLRLNYLALLRPIEVVRTVCAAHAGETSAPVRGRNRPKGRQRSSDATKHRGWVVPIRARRRNCGAQQGLREVVVDHLPDLFSPCTPLRDIGRGCRMTRYGRIRLVVID